MNGDGVSRPVKVGRKHAQVFWRDHLFGQFVFVFWRDPIFGQLVFVFWRDQMYIWTT